MENKKNTLNGEELKQVSGGNINPGKIGRFECLECRQKFEAEVDNAVCPNCGSKNCLPEAM